MKLSCFARGYCCLDCLPSACVDCLLVAIQVPAARLATTDRLMNTGVAGTRRRLESAAVRGSKGGLVLQGLSHRNGQESPGLPRIKRPMGRASDSPASDFHPLLLPMKRLPVLLALSLPLLSTMTACTSQLRRSEPVKLPEPPPQSCAVTTASERVAALLDQRAFNAAEGLFNQLLEAHPDDARLHVDYVRFLLLTSDLAYSGNISSPILSDGRYWARNVADEAGRRASQLDASCKDLLAEVIHSTLLSRIEEALASDKGIIGEPGSFYYPRPNAGAMETGFSSSMIQLGWLGLEASPTKSAGFVSRYRELMEEAIRKGKIATAAMLGNLLGDLEKGDTSGDLDFSYACDAFARALANFQPSNETDWIANTIHIFQDIFGKDLEQAASTSAPESMSRLQQELRSRGYDLFPSGQSPFGLSEGPTGASPGQP